MAIYAEYLDFDTEEDKLKQQQLYQATELSAQTAAAVKKISRPQNWLLAAAPYCPDCRVFVPFIQKMAELNPNIRVNYIARNDFDDSGRFDNPRQQEIVRANQKIPALFLMGHEEAGPVFNEFPQVVLNQIAANETRRTELRDAYRAGEFNADIEAQIVAALAWAEQRC